MDHLQLDSAMHSQQLMRTDLAVGQIDGNVTIAGLDGDMWAERLVTFQSNGLQVMLTFNCGVNP